MSPFIFLACRTQLLLSIVANENKEYSIDSTFYIENPLVIPARIRF